RKDSFNGRVDYHRGMHSVYAAGGIEHGTIKIPGGPWGADNPFYVPPSNFWTAPQIADKNPYAAIGDTLILSPTLLVDFRLGVHRINTIFGARSTPNFDYDAIGIPPSIQNIFALPGSAPDVLTSRWTNL